MVLTDDEFKLFSQLIYNESGIAIKEAKKEFLLARLRKRLQLNQLDSFYRYYKFVTDKAGGQRELLDLLDSLTINETSFFRNRPQFDILASLVIPELKKKRAEEHKLRFWSAGCSRGQEAYSIAMSLLDHLDIPNSWDIKIIASDISLRVLEFAQKGLYNKNEIETVCPEYQREYFESLNQQYQV